MPGKRPRFFGNVSIQTRMLLIIVPLIVVPMLILALVGFLATSGEAAKTSASGISSNARTTCGPLPRICRFAAIISTKPMVSRTKPKSIGVGWSAPSNALLTGVTASSRSIRRYGMLTSVGVKR